MKWIIVVILVLITRTRQDEEVDTEGESCLYAPSLPKVREGLFFIGNPSSIKEPRVGSVICPDDDCLIVGDSRTDIPRGIPGSLDIHAADIPYYTGKTTSKASASVVGNLLRARNKVVEFGYGGCSNWKIFYEGVNFTPFLPNNCAATVGGWSNMKRAFYESFYKGATQFRCFEYMTPTVDVYAGAVETTMPGCGDGDPIGLSLVQKVTGAGQRGISRMTGLDPQSAYIFAFCYYEYRSAGDWAKVNPGTTEPPYLTVTDGAGNRVVEWSQMTDGYGMASSNIDLRCQFPLITGTTSLEISSWDRFMLVPRRGFRMRSKTEAPLTIQVIESIWQPQRYSDPQTQRSACQSLGKNCVYFSVPEYIGIYDDGHGDLTVRRIFNGQKGGGPNFCEGKSYPDGCPFSCKGVGDCTRYISAEGDTATQVSPYSSFVSYGLLYSRWTLTYPGGETVSRMLDSLSTNMANEWNSGYTKGGEALSLSLLGMKSEISNFEVLGYKSNSDNSRWCIKLECLNCTKLFDIEQGRPRIAPFVVQEIVNDGMVMSPIEEGEFIISLTGLIIAVLGMVMIIAIIIWICVKGNRRERPRASDKMSLGYVNDV